MHTYEANTGIALCVGSTRLQLFAHKFNLIFNFFSFSLKVVLFMLIVFFSPEESKMGILQSLSLLRQSLYIQSLFAAAAHSVLELCHCVLAPVCCETFGMTFICTK